MALAPPIILEALLANGVAGVFPFNGPTYPQLCLAVANAVSAWAVSQPQNLGLVGVSVGVSGAGAIVTPASSIIVPPAVPLMLDCLLGAGIAGPLAASLATSMTLGICEAFLAAEYVGIVGGVSTGDDVSKIVISDPASLIGIMEGTFPGAGLSGLGTQQLIVGLGTGIATLLLGGEGTAATAGVPTVPPFPSVGVSTSFVI